MQAAVQAASAALISSWPTRFSSVVWLKGAVLSRSVESNSLPPHELYPTRLLCPWASPGKNTGGGCHAFLQGIFLTQGSNPGLLHCRRIPYCPRICIYTCHPVTPWWSLSGVSTDHTGQYHTWSVWVYYTHSGRYNIARTSSSQFSALAEIISASFWSRTWTKQFSFLPDTLVAPCRFLRHLHCWRPIFCQAHTEMQPSSALSSDYLEIQSIVWNLQII